VPETPSQNPAGKGENRQSIKNEENHKIIFGMNLSETHAAQWMFFLCDKHPDHAHSAIIPE
jgi:hypothetical protein